MKLFIIDTIGPFISLSQRKTINWSKIPFAEIEKNGYLWPQTFRNVAGNFSKFIHQACELGYNAISIDDLAHLVILPFYPEFLKKKIAIYRDNYHELFRQAKDLKLKIFINTDLVFFNEWIKHETRMKENKIIDLLQTAIEQLFQEFDVDGIITRIGESDGVDVKGDFISQLVIKTPEQANRYIQALLPIFENYNKLMIFRTWTVGVFPIGDLIWNPDTFAATFKNISSPNFVISMKYGDTDFYDYLQLNRLIKSGSQQKILELQTRREREGFGEIPYYTGWQYYKYYKQLKDYPELIGISVWCQTGGWCQWKNYTLLKKSSVWNELNTRAAIQMFRFNNDPDTILLDFFNNEKMLLFVKRYHKLYRNLLYIKGFREQQYYIFKTRVPPLVWIFWDHIIINPVLIALLEYAGQKKFKIPRQQIKNLHKMGKKLKVENIDYLCDTLMVLAICRRIFWKRSIRPSYTKELFKYEKKYPHSFKFSIHVSQPVNNVIYGMFKILLRKQPRYRLLDRILMSKPSSLLIRFLLLFLRKSMPTFVNKLAMKIEWLVK